MQKKFIQFNLKWPVYNGDALARQGWRGQRARNQGWIKYVDFYFRYIGISIFSSDILQDTINIGKSILVFNIG